MALKFTGALNKHMKPRRLGLLMSEAEIQEKNSEEFEEDMKNLVLLCEHFKIPKGPNQIFSLLLALARETVPAFREKEKEGRPQKWDEVALGYLAVEVERLTSTGSTLEDAVKSLSIRKPWVSFLEKWDGAKSFGPDPAAALKTAYRKAKKNRMTKIFREAFKAHEYMKTIPQWDARVLELK